MKSPISVKHIPSVDTVLGPEMNGTGEVIGVADNFGEGCCKAQLATRRKLPSGRSVHQRHRSHGTAGRRQRAGREPDARRQVFQLLRKPSRSKRYATDTATSNAHAPAGTNAGAKHQEKSPAAVVFEPPSGVPDDVEK